MCEPADKPTNQPPNRHGRTYNFLAKGITYLENWYTFAGKISTILRYLYFIEIYQFSTSLYLHSIRIQRQILSFLTLVNTYFAFHLLFDLMISGAGNQLIPS